MTDIRDLLRREFARRKKSNPRYSLRAFANHIKISPSSLSKILRNYRLPRPITIEKIAYRLKLPSLQIDSLKKEGTRKAKRRKTHQKIDS